MIMLFLLKMENKLTTVLSLLSAHALISAHPCFFPIIPQVEPNKRPPLHLRLCLLFCSCRSTNYAHKPLKTRPRGTHISSVCMRLDIYGDRSRDFIVSSDLLHCFSTSQ